MILRFEKLRLLVLVGRVQEKLGVDDTELLVVLMDASLSEDGDLVALGKGVDRDGPFFEGETGYRG